MMSVARDFALSLPSHFYSHESRYRSLALASLRLVYDSSNASDSDLPPQISMMIIYERIMILTKAHSESESVWPGTQGQGSEADSARRAGPTDPGQPSTWQSPGPAGAWPGWPPATTERPATGWMSLSRVPLVGLVSIESKRTLKVQFCLIRCRAGGGPSAAAVISDKLWLPAFLWRCLEKQRKENEI